VATDLMDVSTAEHFKALGHPTRQRLLFELDRPATISQLAASLGTHKGNVAHHLKVLRAAALVSITSTRRVRGGTEQYYQRVAQIMRITGDEATAALPATFRAIAAEVSAAAPDPYLMLRHLRLTGSQVERITATLNELAHNTEEADQSEPRYGLLLGLYRQLDADADVM
jgi:DNA-binding transcriptional ArsR family regulator